MVRYFCSNCDDLDLKQISTVLDHIWSKHGVEVQKYRSLSAFRCSDCEISFKNISLFLRHIDKTHGIHIWYEKGITKKRVFFDGILNEPLKKENKTPEKTCQFQKRKYPPHNVLMSQEKVRMKNEQTIIALRVLKSTENLFR
jgi:uncharacterized C2H2 Zn-finger protein